VAAEIIHDDDVAWFEDRNELLLHIGAEALNVGRTVEDAGAVNLSQRRAPRKVNVRQWPCGAKLRTRSPFGPRAAGACWSRSRR
jgi:hypothetical protein